MTCTPTLEIYRSLMKSGAAGLPRDGTQAPILELAHVWHDVVLDLGHYKPGTVTDDDSPFVWEGDELVCTFRADTHGTVDMGEERFSFEELVDKGLASARGDGVYAVPVRADTLVAVEHEGNAFIAQLVEPGKRVQAKLRDRIDYPFLGVMAFFGLVLAAIAITVVTSPALPENEMIELPNRIVDLTLTKPEPVVVAKAPDKGGGEEGAKAKREEGRSGKREAKLKEAKGDRVEVRKRELDREIAERSGVLAALDNDALASLSDTSLSATLTQGVGSLIGVNGVRFGSGGLGDRGPGLGNGGTADGIGGTGTKGTRTGDGTYGREGGEFGVKPVGGTGRIGGDPIILGALDKGLIDAVIKRNMSQIRYCYQRELTKNPDLAGKVSVKFVISKTGSVARADVKSSSLESPAVESCLANRFVHFTFPEPKGGGIVIVTYPFLFAPG
jgi:hypothetical protein